MKDRFKDEVVYISPGSWVNLEKPFRVIVTVYFYKCYESKL